MDVEKDAINLERLAIIDAKCLAILVKNALKYLVMLKLEYIANVITDISMLSVNQ